MTDAWARTDIDSYALETSVGLLDALLDACASAETSSGLARYASDLKRLGTGAAIAASDLAVLIGDAPMIEVSAETVIPLVRAA